MSPEEAFFRSFVDPPQRRRYMELLGTVRGRGKLLTKLDHLQGLDARCCQLVPPADLEPEAILRILCAAGAPRLCSVISANPDLDGREMLLSQALHLAVGGGYGTVITCVPRASDIFAAFGNERDGRFLRSRPRPAPHRTARIVKTPPCPLHIVWECTSVGDAPSPEP